MKTLADLLPLQEGQNTSMTGIDSIAQRLSEMGFTPGQAVRVIRFAPLGDPMQVRLRGFNVALRRNEARRILLTPA
jgi:Fe2+ transport system protein FeoA